MTIYGSRMQNFWDTHSAWSQTTFGTDAERGPIGALKHLEMEAREAQEKPGDREEFADCFLLTCDAARRAGMTLDDLLNEAFAKLAKNKLRVWPKPTSDEPSQHVRGIHD
jgi:Protein of unknown function (DUF550)